ncbi:MAG TPA: creatininase family protein [Candidatus Dormibacteraeota bacterium]|jgi:creatinine amidohydrolase/Fe(II)-dependent formamide hydrolase-like protein
METHGVYLGNLPWTEIKERIDTHPVVIFPIGAVEQHGPHMPLLTDTLMVRWLAIEAAQRTRGILVAPELPYGMSANHARFAGTATLGVDTLRSVIVDVGESLLSHGFKTFVILNGHGGNNATAAVAAIELRRRTGKTVANIYTAALVKNAYKELECEVVWHADEAETSAVLAAMPQVVAMDRAVREIPAPMPLFEFTEEALSHSVVDLGIPATDLITKSGTIGDATLARPEKGRRIVDEQIEHLSHILTSLVEASSN